ncbi:hypothetical protein ACP613_004446 [Enterobacter ludwigii]
MKDRESKIKAVKRSGGLSMPGRNHGAGWTVAEMNYVGSLYGSIPAQEIADKLGRSVNGVRRIAGYLGVTKKSAGVWDEEQLKILRQYYKNGHGLEEVMKRLPGRTKESIAAQASKQGIAGGKKSWGLQEKSFLIKHYGLLSTHEIAQALGRSVSAVRGAVNMLNLGKRSSGPWTEAEKVILKARYGRYHDMLDIQSRLPGRTRHAIQMQASLMSLTFAREWSENEEYILRKYYPIQGGRTVDKLPDRTVSAVNHHAKALGLKYQPHKQRQE